MLTPAELISTIGCSFFTGVPDSLLKPLCNYLMNTYGVSDKHIIAANEGNCVALAAGYYLSTGKIPCVYMQNSGLGNAINPIASLLNPKVYGIPCFFIVGWRGEPGVKDEPQHIFQGEVTMKLLETMDIAYMVLDQETTKADLEKKMQDFNLLLAAGQSVALVVKKGALKYEEVVTYRNSNKILREEAIKALVKAAQEDIILSTTGKTSRELFEIREEYGASHKYDFLTVGSMGHSSSIALGIALNKPETRIWCIDGDGAVLMHMGSMAVIGAHAPKNYVHVVINNTAHESVGGLPTVAGNVNLTELALACGYQAAYTVDNLENLEVILETIKGQKGPLFLEVKAAIGSRENLGRPTTTPADNKAAFMAYLEECE